MRNTTNTCGIKLLKKAFIGVGVRMTGDKSTVPFENLPMKNMVIEDYDKRGFSIKHPSFPDGKSIWVEFEQLPLTRLNIINGVIQDEITFVENIVRHQMQLIRTLDTEYIDLLYAEKALENKADDIIPISAVIPGHVYIGAQCEHNNEMIYLGTWYIKELKVKNEYGYGRAESRTRYYFHKASPQRAFFLMPSDEVSSKERKELYKKLGHTEDGIWKLDWDVRQELYKKYEVAKREYFKNTPKPRYKIFDFPITSKIIKKVIKLPQINTMFTNEELNLNCVLSANQYNHPAPETEFQLTYGEYFTSLGYIAKSKINFEEDARSFAKLMGTNLEPKFYEDRNNK